MKPQRNDSPRISTSRFPYGLHPRPSSSSSIFSSSYMWFLKYLLFSEQLFIAPYFQYYLDLLDADFQSHAKYKVFLEALEVLKGKSV